MKEQDTTMKHLEKVFENLAASANGRAASSFNQFKHKAFTALQQSSFPDRKHEDWRYTAVNKIIAPPYQLPSTGITEYTVPSIEGLESHVITIINGKVNLNHSTNSLAQSGIQLSSLNDSYELQEWHGTFGKWLQTSPGDANKAFDFLNFSFNTAGFFINIPKNTVLDKPIEIRIIHDDPGVSFSHPLYFIKCGSGSAVDIIERFENNPSTSSPGSDNLINSVGFIHLEKNSKIHYTKWQNIGRTQHMVYKLFVTQARDSRFEMLTFDKGGSIVRNNIEVELEENNTYTSLQAGYYATGKQSMDHQTRINHKVAYCESHELYKGIIDDQGSGAFNGKVLVHKDAQKTNAYQQNDTLVLSQHALMNSKPQLEIFADDVKCSHGATIGQLDERALFYLRSRGLPVESAKQMLKDAFIAEVIEKIPHDAVRKFISSQMTNRP